MSKQSFRMVQKLFLMVFSATTLLISAALAQSPAQSAPPAGSPVTQAPSRNLPPLPANRAHMYYALVWGIESPSVKAVESGEIIRFTYHVVDPTRAKILNDKSVDPALIDPEKGVKLVVPSLEQVGMLRQTSTPEAGKSYWMAFSNTGRIVRPGDRVTVQIGNFHADGLIVE